MFDCLFETNFLTSPFWNPSCFNFWLFLFFSSVVLVFVFMVYGLAFLFLCWLCFWCSFVFVLYFCFCLVSCFAFSLWQKAVFLAILVLFFQLCWLKGSLFFMFYVFVLVCFSCVVSFHFKEFICIILFLCFCHKTKWSSCEHLVVLVPFFFWLFCFDYCLFFHSSQKKDPPKKPDTAKTKKNKNAEKPDKKTVSAVVFTKSFLQFLGWALKLHVWLKTL